MTPYSLGPGESPKCLRYIQRSRPHSGPRQGVFLVPVAVPLGSLASGPSPSPLAPLGKTVPVTLWIQFFINPTSTATSSVQVA
jgi:hypothetical protein